MDFWIFSQKAMIKTRQLSNIWIETTISAVAETWERDANTDVRYLTTALLQYCTICQIVDLASIGVPGSRQPLLLNADDKSFIFSTGSFIVLAADHHEVLCRSCGREVENFKHIKLRFKILIETSESITIVQWSLVDCWHRSICWDPKPFVDNVQFVGPKLLKPRWQIRLSSKCPLSPQTSFTDRFVNAAINLFTFFKCFLLFQNLTLFGSTVRLPVEKLRNPAGAVLLHLHLLPFTIYLFSIQVLSLRWSPLRELAALGLEPGPLRPPGIQATSGRPASAQSAGIT